MKFSGKTLMSIGLMVITAYAVIPALKWPLRTAIFPVTVSILVFLIAIIELLLRLYEGEETAQEKTDGSLKSLGGIAQPLPSLKMLVASAWTMGFLILILLIGFPISVPLFAFLYLKCHGKESWWISIGLAALASACFYGLFVWLLHLPFPEGFVQRGIQVLGVI